MEEMRVQIEAREPTDGKIRALIISRQGIRV